MTFRDTPWPGGTPCWIDLMAPDPRMAMDFYGALLGWDFADQGDDTGNYLLCSMAGRPVAGIAGTPPGQESERAAWTTYLASTDADRTASAITGAGGQLLAPPMDVASAGRMAIATDPAGATFGIWQAGGHTGTQVFNTAGALVWNECMTRDFATAKTFYGSVFGYGFDDMSGEGFTYATFTVEGNVAGGLGELPADVPASVPAHWTVYFGVADTDATAARVTELGGSVTRPPADSPYGRVCPVTDNQGAAFNVISVDDAVAPG